DVQVEYVRFVNDDDGNLKLDTALATGQNADLFVNYAISRVEKRLQAGVALDLSQFTDYNIEEKMGPDAKDWKIEDKYYALPTKANKFFVWLNKDALDAAQLPVPYDWTWDDMKMYAEKLTKQGSVGLIQHLEVFPDAWDNSIAAEGYVKADGSSNLDNAYGRKLLQTLSDMMKAGTTPALGEQLTSKMPVDTMFLKGEAGMLNAGEWIFRSSNNMKDNPRTFKIAFAPVPKVSGDQANYKYRGGLGDAISINAKSAYVKEAWEFLKWYADGGMAPLAAGGRLPSSKDANLDEAIKSLLGTSADTYDQESLKKVVFGQFETYNRNVPQQVLDLRREEYEKYFLKSQNIDETMKQITTRHNEFLKK
ncbi:MAG TPA: extracellular solute-binding protein, partial [Bacilli bacterium]